MTFPAHDLSKSHRQMFGDEISAFLRYAKKMRFRKIEAKRIQQEIDLQSYLNKLICEDLKR